MVYTYDEVYQATLDYFDGDELATSIWMHKYALKDLDGNFLERTPDDMHRRMAREIIKYTTIDELTEEEVYEALKDFRYLIPQGSIMYALGNDKRYVSTSNCFLVDSPYDSYAGIMKTDQELAQIMKRRGGVGVDISTLRPKGAKVMNSSHHSTGVVTFMERFSNTTREVAIEGRRGALMLTISSRHPDVLDFIRAKVDLKKVTGANISVRVDDALLEAVKNDDYYELRFPVDSDDPTIRKRVKAREIWDAIVDSAWRSAEPGFLLWNNVLKESPADEYYKFGFKTEGTNPCFRGDMKILTEDGYKTFESLDGRDVKLRDNNGTVVNGRVWMSGVKPVYGVLLSTGKVLYCTGDHVFMCSDGATRMAKHLKGSKLLSVPSDIDDQEKQEEYPEVLSVDYVGEFPVYDFKLTDDNPWGVVEGFVVHNCSEIPLSPYDSCRLLAINLYSFVENPFTENALFDYDKFGKYVALAVKIMNVIVDIEIAYIGKIIDKIKSDPEPADVKKVELDLWYKILDAAKKGRRTGIGITALADTLAALGLKYDSDEAIDTAEKIFKTLAYNAYKESNRLGRKYGHFPVATYRFSKWSKGEIGKSAFIQRLKDTFEDLSDVDYRRNIALLTVAPTGSVSLLTRTSSGIEPVFKIYYKRRRKVNPNDKNVKITFVDDLGDAWEEYNVIHPKFLEWCHKNGYDVDQVKGMSDKELDKLVEKSPYRQSTANEISYVKKLEMLGRIQKWIDHAISNTLNLPENITKEEVSDIYMKAWEYGLKGVTIYREGCRSGVLVSKDEKKFKEHHSPKRPKKLKAEIVRFVNNKEKWIAVIGLLDGRPYEIFTGKLEDMFDIPTKYDAVYVVKNKVNKKSRYDLEFHVGDDKIVFEGLNRIFNKEYWNYAKLISGVLRHGMPLQYVINLIENLRMDSDLMNTWNRGVARALKKFIKDGTKSKNVCSKCGGELVYVEGCEKCLSCGEGKCN